MILGSFEDLPLPLKTFAPPMTLIEVKKKIRKYTIKLLKENVKH